MGRPKSTHCKRGHEFTPENSYVPASGQRTCRECGRLRARENYTPTEPKGRQYLVVAVLPGGRSRLCMVRDLTKAFERFRRQWAEPFLPVAVFPAERGPFLARAGLKALPANVSTEWVRLVLGRAPLVPAACGPVFKQARHLGSDVAAGLLKEFIGAGARKPVTG